MKSPYYIALFSLVSWGLFSFASMNLSLFYFKNIILIILSSAFILSFINSFFIQAIFKSNLTLRHVFTGTSIFVFIILILQVTFEHVVKIRSYLNPGFYVLVFLCFFISGIVWSILIKRLFSVK